MREHEAVNSGCAKVGSLQYLQTWQLMIVLIFLFLHHEVFSYLQSHQHLDILVFSKSPYYETLAKNPVHDGDFVLLYIHRLAR